MEFLKILEFIKREEFSTEFDQQIHVSVLRNHTIDNLLPYIKYNLIKAKVNVSFTQGEYNNMVQESINPSATIYEASPRAIVVSLTLHEYINPEKKFAVNVEAIKEELTLIFDNLIKNSSALIIPNLFQSSFFEEWGIAQMETTFNSSVQELNKFIASFAKSNPSRFFIIDFNRLLAILGQEKSMDYRFGYSARQYFKNDFFELYAQEITKILKALLGKNKKCLVLDCDNTLWKGIIGEDGMEGIKLSKSGSPGNIFYDFQSTVLQLYERGVIITLCSKNNELDVFEVLDNHPDSLLKRSHLAAWRINWDNKAQNIAQLAEELNIGLDSFVFVDDNPVECNLVKEHLPMVEVIQVPEKLYMYPGILMQEGFFDTLAVSVEDKKRNQLYQAESLRKHSQKEFKDISDYLNSLGIEVTVSINDASSIPRLAQLTQKTNQFNLTTKRYSEEEVKQLQEKKENIIFQFSVKDKYGDMGLTGMLIAKKTGNEMLIDNFLLSCRILGRDIETAFIDYCLDYMIQLFNPSIIKANYIRTKKNGQTENFWKKTGFEILEENNEEKKYQMLPENFSKKQFEHIKIQTA